MQTTYGGKLTRPGQARLWRSAVLTLTVLMRLDQGHVNSTCAFIFLSQAQKHHTGTHEALQGSNNHNQVVAAERNRCNDGADDGAVVFPHTNTSKQTTVV